jgi:hypothetical protein
LLINMFLFVSEMGYKVYLEEGMNEGMKEGRKE